jgi:hypothetical protein
VVMLLSSKPKWSPGIPKWSATVVTSLQGNRRQYSKHVSPPLECSHLLVLLPNRFCWCFYRTGFVGVSLTLGTFDPCFCQCG